MLDLLCDQDIIYKISIGDKAVFDLTEYSQVWLVTNSSSCGKDVVSNRRNGYKEMQEKYETINTVIDKMKIDNGLPDEVREVFKSNEKLLKWIESWVGNALQGYRGFMPIRIWADEDEEAVRDLLRAAFKNYVLRYDPRFIEKYMAYRLKKEDMVMVLQLLDSLTDYYIISHMTKNAIREDFEDETGLNDDLCDFYAGLIEENYQLLLMNYIVESFADVRRRDSGI